MLDEKINIKEGITLHKIQTNKFKTNLFAIFLSMPLTRENVTKNALITAILRRGTKRLTTQEEISKNLEEMYGASFDCGIEKSGDYHTMKFYLELLNDEYLPKQENLSKEGLDLLLDIAFNPYIENDSFKEEYVAQEKQNLKQIIEGKIDNKGNYAYERCIEEMYKNKPYGLYKYGYIEDLEKITAKELYEHYKEIISTCKIDIFVSSANVISIENIVKENDNIQKLNDRNLKIEENNTKDEINEPNIVNESMNITQGKLVIGMDIIEANEDINYIAMIYNTILGAGANSKLFRNVREKESLAYVCASNYIKRKQIIIIRAGIEIGNYEKALEKIKKEVEDIEKGDFTQEDIENAKNLIYATINSIEEEQDTEISYYFGQEIAGKMITVEEYRQRIKEVTKEQIINLANSIKINTIYFLKD